MFLFQSDMNSSCYGNLKFPLTFSRKRDNWQFMLSMGLFGISFTKMFIEQSSIFHMYFVQIA